MMAKAASKLAGRVISAAASVFADGAMRYANWTAMNANRALDITVDTQPPKILEFSMAKIRFDGMKTTANATMKAGM